MDAITVLITSKEDEAPKIARTLVEERLAACVNIISGVRSVYTWQGKVEDDSESLMVLKSRAELFDAIVSRVKELHSYDVPEIIALPIVKGSSDYLDWISDVTG